MLQETKNQEQEKFQLWLAIVNERRGRYASKNWIDIQPLSWPALPEHLDGVQFSEQ